MVYHPLLKKWLTNNWTSAIIIECFAGVLELVDWLA